MTRLSVVVALMTVVGCGSSDEVTSDAAASAPDASSTPDATRADAARPDAALPDASPPADAAPPDAASCVALVTPAVGAPCADDIDCGLTGTCLDENEGLTTTGYCTRQCTADASCGEGAFCSDPIGDGAGTRFCMARCCGDASCGQADHLCGTTLFGLFALGGQTCLPGNSAAGDGAACSSFGDCNVSSMCNANPYDSPGGYCMTVGCTVGDNTTCASGGDGVCIDFGTGDEFPPACVDDCNTDTDCRMAEGYRCVNLGVAKACLYQHLDPGAACTDDQQCGVAPWKCLTGAAFPGGYCGGVGCAPNEEDSCSEDSFCYDPTIGSDGDEYCAAVCTGNTDCREGDGYSCVDLNGQMGCAVVM